MSTKAKSKPAAQVSEATAKAAEKLSEQNGVIIFKALRPLDEKEHRQLSDKIRYEAEKSGLKVVLMPYTCELAGDSDAD